MSEFFLKYASVILPIGGLILWAHHRLRKVPDMEKAVKANSNDIIELKASTKHIHDTLGEVKDTIKAEHEKDREIMLKLIEKIK